MEHTSGLVAEAQIQVAFCTVGSASLSQMAGMVSSEQAV